MALLLVGTSPAHPEGDDGMAVRLLFTNNSNGKLVNCNCRNDTLGGLSERVSFITTYRDAHEHTVLVDSGGWLGLSDDAKSGGLVFGLMDLIGYDAIGVGDQELYHGLGTFLDRYDDNRGIFISASLRDGGGKQVFTPWRVVTENGMHIGIIGLMSEETFRFFPDDRRDFTVVAPDTVLGEILPELAGSCDIIVVLSQMGFEEDRALAGRWPEIGVIVGGHSQTLIEEPIRVGNTTIMQAGKGGGRVGEIVLVQSEDGTVRIDSNRLIEIDETYTISPEIRSMLNDAGITAN